jgi:hypothetical protein
MTGSWSHYPHFHFVFNHVHYCYSGIYVIWIFRIRVDLYDLGFAS